MGRAPRLKHRPAVEGRRNPPPRSRSGGAGSTGSGQSASLPGRVTVVRGETMGPCVGGGGGAGVELDGTAGALTACRAVAIDAIHADVDHEPRTTSEPEPEANSVVQMRRAPNMAFCNASVASG